MELSHSVVEKAWKGHGILFWTFCGNPEFIRPVSPWVPVSPGEGSPQVQKIGLLPSTPIVIR